MVFKTFSQEEIEKYTTQITELAQKLKTLLDNADLNTIGEFKAFKEANQELFKTASEWSVDVGDEIYDEKVYDEIDGTELPDNTPVIRIHLDTYETYDPDKQTFINGLPKDEECLDFIVYYPKDGWLEFTTYIKTENGDVYETECTYENLSSMIESSIKDVLSDQMNDELEDGDI